MPRRFRSAIEKFAKVGLSAVLIAPMAGGAAEWTAEPSIKLRREYDDNHRLSVHPHQSVSGSIITPSLDLGVAAPAWKISGGAQATRRRYSGEEGLDRDENLLKLSSFYKTERSTWQLDASRARDSTITGVETNTDTGAISTLKKREATSISPSWIWMASERTQLQLAYQRSDVSYVDAVRVGLYDYRYDAVTATLANQLSVLNQVFVSGGYSSFRVAATGFDSDTQNLQAGITRNFSETTKGTLQAGLRRTESFIPGGRPIYTRFSTIFGDVLVQTGVTQDARRQTTGSVFSGNLETRHENTEMNISFSRALNPSGFGGQMEQDQIKLRLSKQFTPRASAYVNGNALKVRTVEGNISNSGHTFYDFGPGIYWRWMRDWNVNMNYRYAHVKRAYETNAASSRSVDLTVVYQPVKISISR